MSRAGKKVFRVRSRFTPIGKDVILGGVHPFAQLLTGFWSESSSLLGISHPRLGGLAGARPAVLAQALDDGASDEISALGMFGIGRAIDGLVRASIKPPLGTARSLSALE
jgi:hypothetical protein